MFKQLLIDLLILGFKLYECKNRPQECKAEGAITQKTLEEKNDKHNTLEKKLISLKEQNSQAHV